MRGRAPILDGTSTGTTATSHLGFVLIRVQVWDKISAGTMATTTTITLPGVLHIAAGTTAATPLIRTGNQKGRVDRQLGIMQMLYNTKLVVYASLWRMIGCCQETAVRQMMFGGGGGYVRDGRKEGVGGFEGLIPVSYCVMRGIPPAGALLPSSISSTLRE